jgi:hypothetical protein
VAVPSKETFQIYYSNKYVPEAKDKTLLFDHEDKYALQSIVIDGKRVVSNEFFIQDSVWSVYLGTKLLQEQYCVEETNEMPGYGVYSVIPN